MTAEVVIVACYAVALLGLGAVIRRVGDASTDAFSSRMFAAYRTQAPVPPDPTGGLDWPHSEAPRLYRTVAAVAVVAGIVLCVAEAVRHHRAGELVLLGAAAVSLGVTLGRWLRLDRRAS